MKVALPSSAWPSSSTARTFLASSLSRRSESLRTKPLSTRSRGRSGGRRIVGLPAQTRPPVPPPSPPQANGESAASAATSPAVQPRTYLGSGGRLNQSQPTGSGLSIGSHPAQGKFMPCFSVLPCVFGLPFGHANSLLGSLVKTPLGPVLANQQLPPPSSSHQKSTPLGSRRPSGRIPMRFPMYLLLCDVS